MKHDLEERTSKFGENVIKFLKTVKVTSITKPLISQLIRSATSIGANYMEANQASSRKDFKNKIRISQKESNETKYWLRMLSIADESCANTCRELWKEAHALTLIFAKISRTLKNSEI